MASNFIKTKDQVENDFNNSPNLSAPLRAFIIGGHGKLHRYAVAAEKSGIALGAYDPAISTDYAWPGRSASSLIDQDYAKLFIDNALLRYFSDLTGAGSTIAPVAGKPNRVRSSSISFRANGASYPRSASLYDRDVAAGDVVYVRGSDGGEDYELLTYVLDTVGEPIAAVTGSASGATSNASSQSFAIDVDKIGGPDNCLMAVVDGSSYDGLLDGDIDEIYTVEVTQGSVDGDLTQALVRVTSASGRDDEDDVSPAEVEEFFDIGSRGLRLKWTNLGSSSCSSAAEGEEVSPIDLIAGQKIRISVSQAFTAPTATSGGDYTGTTDLTYIVEVTKGGLWADEPEITVSTTNGTDSSGPTIVPGADEDVAVGVFDVVISWSGNYLRKGDKYLITATAAKEGAMRTLVLGHDLPLEIQDASDLDLKLYIKKDLEISKNRTGHAPTTNWSTDEDDFTVNSGILAFDSSWTDGGVELELPVEDGDMFLEYREWLSTYVGKEGSVSTEEAATTALGDDDVDTELGCAVHKAVALSTGTAVKFTAVEDPSSLDSWEAALDMAVGRNNIYNIVPLTFDPDVLALVNAHVPLESTVERGRMRAAILCLQAQEDKAIAAASTSSDEEVILATLEDDPDEDNTQYTLMRLTSGNFELVEGGVEAGDNVRYIYTTDGFGGATYQVFTIEEVLNETTLRLTSGHTVAIDVPQKVEIWRNLTPSQIVDDLLEQRQVYESNRICVVWPDVVENAGVEYPGYILAAALAGRRSGMVPHQPLTNVEITGFDAAPRAYPFLNENQLLRLIEGGVWVVRDDEDGTVYSQHAVTTDTSDVDAYEESIRVELDAVSYQLRELMKQFKGSGNVVDDTLNGMRATGRAGMEHMRSATLRPYIGGLVTSYGTVVAERHAILRDTTKLIVSDVQLPYANNRIDVIVSLS